MPMLKTTNYLIGSTVTVNIVPTTAGLVYMTLRDCDVTHKTSGSSVSILDWDSSLKLLKPVCPLQAKIVRSVSASDPLQFSFAAFKWNTSTPDLIEDQNLVCTLALSLANPNDNAGVCPVV